MIPVDMVTRGMTLIAAALVQRKNARLYQLATSAINPVNMGRSIELTGLAHRKHYKMQHGIDHWLKVKLETISVSKQRYERLVHSDAEGGGFADQQGSRDACIWANRRWPRPSAIWGARKS